MPDKGKIIEVKFKVRAVPGVPMHSGGCWPCAKCIGHASNELCDVLPNCTGLSGFELVAVDDEVQADAEQ